MLQYEEVVVALELAVGLARSFEGMTAMWTGRSCAGHILIAVAVTQQEAPWGGRAHFA